jgi:hypothetical protein
MSPAEYLAKIERARQRHDATEHTYRPDFKAFLESLAEIEATNEPRREKCGAPDYVITRRTDGLTLGYIEAKDIGIDLAQTEKGEQLQRYQAHLPNLLLTDYLEIRWYVQGERGTEKRGSAALGRVTGSGKIVSDADEQAKALKLLKGFLTQRPVRITSAQDLALRLAHLTHMVRDTIVEAFAYGEASDQLRDWRAAFAATLLPELAKQADAKEEAKVRAEFADMFAQTLAYGLFSARAAGPGGKFTREKARALIPRTNPFLRSFFEQITGSALEDEPFAGFVEDIIQTLDVAGMDDILADFGKRGRRSDPVVHFYETFLQAYDPRLRELRGVYYTPEPVVNYIVESLDLLLKSKFGLKEGLADRSQITVTREEAGEKITETSHRVLILDPATGTATFLYRVLDFIREQFERKKKLGAWGDYVHEHLLPRLFGFELLMAPYAVAHFKIGLALAAWDKEPLFRQGLSYEPQKGERINIFLTNTLEDLEETAQQLGPLRMLSDEANSAFEIKRKKPVLVILGNPPYSGHSANKSKWITDLIRDYMVCDGKPLGERNPKWLHDDYVKFIRWAQWRIDQTGQGVLAFITNHGYLDNPTFRGMRQSLMATFDEIYLIDLHGNVKKKEIDPETGAQDKNVFDIQQGVAIGIFVKLPPEARAGRGKRGVSGRVGVPPAGSGVSPERSSEKSDAASAAGKTTTQDASLGGQDAHPTRECVVRHAHLHGSQRAKKYEWLDGHDVENTKWTVLKPKSPNYYFYPRDVNLEAEYEVGWKVTEMMPMNGWGVATRKDYLLVDFDARSLARKMQRILDATVQEAYKLGVRDTPHWSFSDVRPRLKNEAESQVYPYLYRPFDQRSVYYEPLMIERGDHRQSLMRHLLADDGNLSMLVSRTGAAAGSPIWDVLFATTIMSDLNAFRRGGAFVFPLYLYPNGKLPDDDLFVREEPEEPARRPNLSAAFIADFCAKLEVKFVPDGLGHPKKREVGPELIFHYAYAVFHSPAYRARYAEFLRTDFPRLPLTGDYELFRELAGLGGWLVDLHARGHGEGKGPSFPIKGNNVIDEVRYQPPQPDGADRHGGRVWINDRQHFEPVPPEAWAHPIGGYQPAERWLKDRRGRTLGYDDLTAYARIIHALGETRRLMAEIDIVIAAHGGWPAAFVAP